MGDDGKGRRTLPVFEVVEAASVPPAPAAPGGRPFHARGTPERAVRIVEAGLDTLAESMAAFVDGVGEMIAAGTAATGDYTLETVEVQCQISGSGQVGFMGSGMGVEGASSLKIVFRRRPDAVA